MACLSVKNVMLLTKKKMLVLWPRGNFGDAQG